MSAVREVTPHILANPLVCGEFRRGVNYTNWRPRGTEDWLLIHTLAGAGRIVAGAQVRRLGPGETVLFRPGAPQDYATDPETGAWHLQWAHFIPRPHWQPWLIWPEISPGTAAVRLDAGGAARFAAALNRMLVAGRLGGDGAADLALNALEEALIWAHRHLAADPALRLDARVRRAVAHLAADPSRPFSLPDLAAHCGLSASRLSHLFKKELRITPRRFLEDLRLKVAEQLLSATGLGVKEIADEVGFEDPAYFSRRFARRFGRGPIEWRREQARRTAAKSHLTVGSEAGAPRKRRGG